jgi:hypothetical protein
VIRMAVLKLQQVWIHDQPPISTGSVT